MIKQKYLLILTTSLLGITLFSACTNDNPQSGIQKQNDSLATVFKKSLKENILAVWYPLMVDTIDSGYYSNATYDWQLTDNQPKMLVTQARLMWTASEAAIFLDDSAYIPYAKHGFRFLTEKMWDSRYGGFYNIVAKDGSNITSSYGTNKMAYGNAFAIYGFTSLYNLTGDTIALQWAKKTFSWLEEHSHDSRYGGYIDPMNRQGQWMSGTDANLVKPDEEHPVWKDYNSSIHLLEAFTALYQVWPDPLVHERLEEMLTLVRDTFVNPKGYLNLYFTTDWQLVSHRNMSEAAIREQSYTDHISFGHDVETAFLLLEASHALGREHDTTTLRIAKKMDHHALDNGFDSKYGGFYNEGYYFSGSDSITILSKNSQWWIQAEGLHSMLMMAQLFPEETKYRQAFLKTWKYIDRYLIDHRYGGWFIDGLNYDPEVLKANKASIWKGNYHNARALMKCVEMLQGDKVTR